MQRRNAGNATGLRVSRGGLGRLDRLPHVLARSGVRLVECRSLVFYPRIERGIRLRHHVVVLAEDVIPSGYPRSGWRDLQVVVLLVLHGFHSPANCASATRSFPRARASCAFDVPSVTPSAVAISWCV